MRKTYSICPVCLKKIRAEYSVKDDGVYLEKTCSEHGAFSTIVWRGDNETWLKMNGWNADNENDNCPYECGLCKSHRQNTCCIEVEITSKCNLNCSYCFEDGISREKSVEELYELFKTFAAEKRTFLHLSGGEPTVRDDLPEIIAAAKKAGMEYIQLNSNGLRLAEDKDFVKKISEAGLSFVFLQFDGTNDDIYLKTRGRELFEIKKKAIENCSEYKLGVSLVPTLVPGVNIDNIGEIIKFAVNMSPAVRGVHFQPVSYFGRYPQAPENSMRFTLPELIKEIGLQAGIEKDCFKLSGCDHPMCGFHGDFVVMPDGLMPLTRSQQSEDSGCCCGVPVSGETCCCEDAQTETTCCCEETDEEHSGCCCGAPIISSLPETMEAVEKNRKFVGRRWLRDAVAEDEPDVDVTDMEGFVKRIKSHGFTITSMAFQDAYSVDVDRLKHCSLHIYADGKIMPFCLRYILR